MGVVAAPVTAASIFAGICFPLLGAIAVLAIDPVPVVAAVFLDPTVPGAGHAEIGIHVVNDGIFWYHVKA